MSFLLHQPSVLRIKLKNQISRVLAAVLDILDVKRPMDNGVQFFSWKYQGIPVDKKPHLSSLVSVTTCIISVYADKPLGWIISPVSHPDRHHGSASKSSLQTEGVGAARSTSLSSSPTYTTSPRSGNRRNIGSQSRRTHRVTPK